MVIEEPVELHVDVHPGTGPFLLLVHGFLSSRAQWHLNLEALSEVVQPVVVELWGHGRSPSPEHAAMYHPNHYVAAFDRVREQLGVDRWLICGQSLGGALTLRYSLMHPDRLFGHVFTNSNAGLADEEWTKTRRAMAIEQAEAIERDGCDALERIPVHPVHARRLGRAAKAALLEDCALHSPLGIARTLRYTTPEAPIGEALRDIQVPTLLICGNRERRFGPRRGFAERTIAGLRVVETEAGHAVNIEAAEAFNRAVAAFVYQTV